jgi:hypothetical protein
VPNMTLADRRAALEQQKARLADRERKIAIAGRKDRTRRLIECGGLVAKAGLSDLPANALYGALLTLKAASGDPLQVKRWSADGGAAFSRENRDQKPGIMAAAE